MFIVVLKALHTSDYYFGPFETEEGAYQFIRDNPTNHATVHVLIPGGNEIGNLITRTVR